MIDIVELEKSWLRYKVKSYLPHLIIFMSLSIITFLGLIFFDTFTTATPAQTPSHEKKVLASAQQAVTTIPVIHKKARQETQLKLQPSLDFVQKMKNERYSYHKEVKKIPKVVKVKQAKIIKKTTIQISSNDTAQNLHTIVQRFKASNDPHLSLFLAKKYYEQKNYQQAYNYALITNKINSKIDESWIVFCKSLVHLGKKKFAIKVLQDYIQSTHSSTATILLSNIKSGKFR